MTNSLNIFYGIPFTREFLTLNPPIKLCENQITDLTNM